MKQSERRARTREQILEAAEQLFSEHGVDGTKIDDIVAAADLAREQAHTRLTCRRPNTP